MQVQTFPTKSQSANMKDSCRWVYIEILEYRKDSREKLGKSASKYETHNLLFSWKRFFAGKFGDKDSSASIVAIE